MTSLPYDQYKAAYDATKSKWWGEIDAKAREMADSGMTLEGFAKSLYDECKWIQYHNVLLLLFLHYRGEGSAPDESSN